MSEYQLTTHLILCFSPSTPQHHNTTGHNPFKKVIGNKIFMGVIVLTVFFQFLMVQFFGGFAETEGLNVGQWFASIGFGALMIPFGSCLQSITHHHLISVIISFPLPSSSRFHYHHHLISIISNTGALVRFIPSTDDGSMIQLKDDTFAGATLTTLEEDEKGDGVLRK